jgi:NAD(P)H-dependent flavin oxidoreductase YrpB (nitropropane dioxygenase family)
VTIRTPLSEELGIEHPIYAFTVHTEVAAAVSRAGGLGVLGALRFSPEELEQELTWLDEHVDGKPYGVDVVMPASYAGAGIGDLGELMEQLQGMIPEEHREFVERVLTEHGVPPLPEGEQVRELLGWTDTTARPQVDVALSHPICLLANALGPPPKDIVDLAHEHGVKVAALVGKVEQALAQVEVGVDVIVAQGTEAAGHTGEVASMVLWPDVVDAVAPRPVLGAGGIGTGRQMAAALALGTQGAWTGSIWLTVEEADVPDVVRRKLIAAGSRDTLRTRTWTGKPARLLRTGWTDAWEDPANPKPLQMPLQWFLTAEAQHRIFRSENEDLIGMPVGQIVSRMNEIRKTEDVVRDMVTECEETLARLHSMAGEPVSQPR